MAILNMTGLIFGAGDNIERLRADDPRLTELSLEAGELTLIGTRALAQALTENKNLMKDE